MSRRSCISGEMAYKNALVNCKELDKSDCFRVMLCVYCALTPVLRGTNLPYDIWEIALHESEILV